MLASLAVFAPRAARAHGRPPFVERVAFDPEDERRLVLQFSFGLFATEDAGASFRWVCGAAYGVDPSWEDPALVVTGDGSVVLGAFDGVVRAAPDLCAFERPAGDAADTFVVDVARGAADTLYAITSRGGGEPDRVQRSRDGGRTWAVLGAPVEALLQTVAVAPSDARRVYVTSAVPATDELPRRTFLLRSDDEGASFETIEVPAEVGELAPRLAAIDPLDPDRLLVRMARDDLSLEPERLLVSEDGGRTLRALFTAPQLRGVAMTERALFVGSAAGGLYRADPSTLELAQVSPVTVRCVAPRGDELWLCVDEMVDGFALGRSRDGGDTIEPVLVMRTMIEALPECARCSATALTCPSWQDDLRYDFATYLGGDAGAPLPDASAPADCLDGGAATDGGRTSDAAPDGGRGPAHAGCGCRAGGGADAASIAPWAALALLRRRRR